MARILLRFGIGFKEFNEVAKAAFVDVASSDFGIRGRPTNISRVAVMTGLTRKEVRRVRDKIVAGEDAVTVNATPVGRILHNWYAVDEFLDDNGKPAVLPFAGDTASFSRLVRLTGGDIPPGALRTELKRVGCVAETDDGRLQLIKRSYVPDVAHENLIGSLVHCIYPIVSTIAHNTDPDRKSDERWPNKTAFSTSIRSSEAHRLRRVARDRIDSFAEAMDDVFSSFEAFRDDVDDSETRVGDSVYVGAFYFEDRNGDQPKP
jgi:hypothetical protein